MLPTTHPIALILLMTLTFSFPILAQSDVETIKDRVRATLLQGAVAEEEISQLLASQREGGTWPGINYEDVSRTGFEHRFHYDNMLDLARAYVSPSSPYHQQGPVKAAIERALSHWVEQDYICDNWWYNQIGTPNALVTLMVIAGDQLDPVLVSKAQPMIRRAHIDAPGARPGGDRIKIAGIQAKNALFLGDAAQFETVIRVIEQEIKFSDWVGATFGYGFRYIPTGFSNRQMGGRGIMHDYSFHHRVDGVNNTLSYGLGYADAFVEWAVYTHGTRFAFSSPKLEQLIDYFLDGICKTAAFGKYPDAGAKNRSISRPGTLRPYSAATAEKLLQTSDYRKEELEEIVQVRKEGAQPTLSHATWYWHTEHFTFQRPDWFASVRMYSTRTHNMEEPYNSEGLLNHHRGDGANHVSVTGDEYLDIWPVYDYQKIPGATIMQKPAMPPPHQIQQLGLTHFVGAATDGTYGAVAFDFRSPHDPLIARKAWFFFDEAYVSLGSGISCKDRDLPVLTTLNQSHLRGSVIISQEGRTSFIEQEEQPYANVEWVYHDQVGYLFPEPETVHLQQKAATGSWWRINKQTDSPKDEIELDVFSLWLDHGIRPSEAEYAYVVMPASTGEQVAAYSEELPIHILANSPEVQAVYHKGLDMCQAVFYEAGAVQIREGLTLSSETPGIVLLQAGPEGDLRLTASDPLGVLSTMHLTLSTRFGSAGESIRATWNPAEEVSEIVITLPQGQYKRSSVGSGD